jgi:hypothetical protein
VLNLLTISPPSSIPQLVPEQICREIPKEVCQTVFLNPRNIKSTALIKYCTNPQSNQDPNQTFQNTPDTDRRDPRTEKLVGQRTVEGRGANRDRLLRGNKFGTEF